MPPKSKTAPSTPRLSEYARKFTFPAGITHTVWPRVEAKGRELGLGFDWWQSQAGTVILGYDESGRYCATVGGVGMSIPRQVGKTYFVLALLVIMCILFPGLQVVWTAHHLRTSTKTFTALRGICRRRKVAPHVKAMRSANGEQQVEFVNGSMIMFGARSMGFGRGFDEIDVEVFDEAQILDTKALEDMIAATNQARHEHGALLFFMGSPPRPSDPSGAFTERRAEAWAGEAEDAVWLEIGADPESDPDDRGQWPLMNPSFPKRTPLESILRLRKNLKDDDSWNREGRGIWDSESKKTIVPLELWERQQIENPAMPHEIGLAIQPGLTTTSVSGAGVLPDGRVLTMWRETMPGVGWVPAFVEERMRQSDVKAVVIDAGAPNASVVIDELRARKIEPTLPKVAEITDAASQYVSGIEDGRLVHGGQPQLTQSLMGSRKRQVKNTGAWTFAAVDESTGDDTQVRSSALAVWGVRSSSVKKPKRSWTTGQTRGWVG